MDKKYIPSALVLYLNYFIHGIGCSILSQQVVKEMLASQWGLKDVMAVTSIAAALGLGRLISLPFAGPLSDKLGRRLSVIIGCASYVIFLVGIAFSPNTTIAYIAAVLGGIANSFLDTATYPAVTEIIYKYTGIATMGIKFFISVAQLLMPFFLGVLIILITIIIAAGGTTFGLAEETIALYPILVPVFLAAGYDVMVCIAAIYMGSSIGTMFPTINPFSVGNASNAAGISLADGMGIRGVALVLGTLITLIYILRYAKKVKEDPTKSICYDQYEHHMQKFGHQGEVPEFTGKMKLSLLVFGVSFGVLVWGLVAQGWWFDNMTALFLACAILLAFTSGIGEKNFMDQFIGGAADLMGVALVVGVARGINIILEDGAARHLAFLRRRLATILEFFSGAISGMNPIVFIILMMLVFIVLGFFISSSSGLAVLSIPIMAPLADTVGVSRSAIVSAYAYGLGLISFITPTGLILASLAMVDVTYDKWLKFIMPLTPVL